MAISQQTKNYEEWKLLNERKKAKERKREREVRHYVGRGMRNAWEFYTQWSVPTLLVFGSIAAAIVYICCRCMNILQSYFV